MVEGIYLRSHKMKNREWRAFKIDEVFEVVDGFYNKKPPMTGGDLPFLGATEKNNGVTGYTDKDTVYQWTKTGEKTDATTKNKLFGPNWIAVTNNGSVGHAYFVPYQYTSSHDVTSLYLPEREISPELGLFLVKMLERVGEPFSYARKWRPIRLRKTPIYLPVTKNGSPDWTFMEEYVQIKSNQIKDTYQLPRQHEITDFRNLDEVEWGEFKLEDIAKIKGGKDWEQYNRVSGQVPFIGSSSINNGVTDFVSPKGRENQVGKGVLGINRNGSVGYVFYHPYSAYFSGDTRFLEINGFKNRKFVNQFIQTMILYQREKYAYGYKMGTQRIKNQIIKLPITTTGQPDFVFMEQYMKRMENKVIQKTEMN